jgi:hypothetical protein
MPQMEVYDRIRTTLAPYLTIGCEAMFKSEVLNTDRCGFRLSYKGGSSIDSDSWWNQPRRGLVLGGSFAFGVGATHDRTTLVSNLNALTDYAWLNLGIRAANSTQELIAAIPFIQSADAVVVCSGLNTLVVGLQSIGKNELFGPLFAEEVLDELAAYSIFDLASIARSNLQNIGLKTLMAGFFARVRRASASAPEQGGVQRRVKGDNVPRSVEAALERQRRDLSILAKALADSSRLIFAVQPYAGVSCKDLSSEEKHLFEIGDDLQGAQWEHLKLLLEKLWPEYVRGLEKACLERGIRFIDLNAMDLSGWSYVDRVHMTDAGYMQVGKRIASELA